MECPAGCSAIGSGTRATQIAGIAMSSIGASFQKVPGRSSSFHDHDNCGAPLAARSARSRPPRSSSARFSERWQKSLGDEGFLDHIVERWRALAIPAGADTTHNLSMMADAIGILETGPLDDTIREALIQRPNPPPPPRTIGSAHGRLQPSPLRGDASPPSSPGYQVPRQAGQQGSFMGPRAAGQAPEPVRGSQPLPKATETSSLRLLRERMARPS